MNEELPAGYVALTRECPRCGKISMFKVPEATRAHVECKTCGMRFEVGNYRRKGTPGSPTNPAGTFKYHVAASHHDSHAFRQRMRAYAKLTVWGAPCVA